MATGSRHREVVFDSSSFRVTHEKQQTGLRLAEENAIASYLDTTKARLPSKKARIRKKPTRSWTARAATCVRSSRAWEPRVVFSKSPLGHFWSKCKRETLMCVSHIRLLIRSDKNTSAFQTRFLIMFRTCLLLKISKIKMNSWLRKFGKTSKCPHLEKELHVEPLEPLEERSAL